jgi:small subunit ribosomal protein S7
MSRRHRAEKREILPDPKFNDLVLSKFMNNLMQEGKKSVAERIVYDALEIVNKKAADDLANDTVAETEGEEGSSSAAAGSAGGVKHKGLRVFHKALKKTAPYLEVRSRRVGGATYQVPVEVKPYRAAALAMRWLIGAARKRSENTMTERLAHEILDAANDRGSAVKKREDTHKMAEANKAFAHFRW